MEKKKERKKTLLPQKRQDCSSMRQSLEENAPRGREKEGGGEENKQTTGLMLLQVELVLANAALFFSFTMLWSEN